MDLTFFFTTLKDRLMAGGSYLGSNSGSSQFYNHGFVDPFTISDVRDHFSDFSSRPTSRFVFFYLSKIMTFSCNFLPQ